MKRYDCNYSQDGTPDLPESPTGGMVTYTDYAALQAKADRLAEAIATHKERMQGKHNYDAMELDCNLWSALAAYRQGE